MSNIDLKRARYFLRLGQELNFSKAAKALKVSQPGLTKAIAQLETDLGGVLIRREGKNTHLTPLGLKTLEHFRYLDMVVQNVEDSIANLINGDMLVLRIGLMCTISPHSVSKFLAKFQARHSSLEVIIRTLTAAELPATLLAGDIDLAFVGAEIGDPLKFRYSSLFNEKMVVASSKNHDFASRKSVSLQEVAEQPYIDRLSCEFRDTFVGEASNLSFSPFFVSRSDNEELALALIAGGVGVSILPEYSAVFAGLAATQIEDTTFERTVMVALPFGREDHVAIRDFMKAVSTYDWQSV